jgi:hypothetical protein
MASKITTKIVPVVSAKTAVKAAKARAKGMVRKSQSTDLPMMDRIGEKVMEMIRDKSVTFQKSTIQGSEGEVKWSGTEFAGKTPQGAGLQIRNTKKADSQVARMAIIVKTADGKTMTVTGKYARRAWLALTKVPKVRAQKEVVDKAVVESVAKILGL